MSQHPVTMVGKKMLDDELESLIKNDREEIKIAIAEAREHGDLKENAEYHSAKEKQSHIEGRIAELQAKLAAAKVVDVSNVSNDKIVFGATVTIINAETEETKTLQIVGEDEAPTSANKISYSSPLGKALIGKEEGDEVIVKAPKGDVVYEVESFEYK
ncbi:MAG: transcription elongation factor GreA [Halobacteriovoraceae bacterium]|nr:transcription elongation factor GreA [Halobacteriovoraceae bacterium]|tara:strand:- start:3137 stop:3610 length:474 start_codon:yes stop_codon:yes gene_type:complete